MKIVKLGLLIVVTLLINSCIIDSFGTPCVMGVPDKFNCMPIKTYQEWNRCVTDCSRTEIGTKAKPYKERRWVRPRPYAYP